MSIEQSSNLILGSAVLSILYGLFLAWKVIKFDSGSEKMKEIALAIQEGASSYLNRQYFVVSIVGVVIFILIWFLLGQPVTAAGFAIGSIASAMAGYIGMNIPFTANLNT